MSEKLPLHPATDYLVTRGAAAVREKLTRAEQKYGYRDGWLSPNWMSECRAKMYHHITKGDPLDVIAYCLFLWHHGAPTCRPGFHVELLDQYDIVLDRRDLYDFARSTIEHALREPQYDGGGMQSSWYLEESTRRADEFVEKFANRIQPVDEGAATVVDKSRADVLTTSAAIDSLDPIAYGRAAAIMGTCPDGPTDDTLKRAIVAYLGGNPWPEYASGPVEQHEAAITCSCMKCGKPSETAAPCSQAYCPINANDSIKQHEAAAASLEGFRRAILAPREIVRDEYGMLSHPSIPLVDESVNYQMFLGAFGIESTFVCMETDIDCDAYEQYVESSAPDCSFWTPSVPDGEGWLLCEIFDTEDGPVALYVRERKPETRRARRKREEMEYRGAHGGEHADR
ncbi:hypothetical protein KDX40_13085 [Burkholderia ambifaria]|uniref:hypothetical protein n=1 Tax=Burkholderia ambifaria TaxID=152480 RepID=UPI001B8EBFDD|nr:hypothetical protein [Burkholderia ambifaria]MBR8344672.1 hypothetical protein [Burkholderia ambifaria]